MRTYPQTGLALTRSEEGASTELEGSPLTARELELLLSLGEELTSDLNPDSLLPKVAETARSLVRAQTVLLPMIDVQELTYTYRVAVGQHAELLRGQTLPISEGACGWVMRHRRPLLFGACDAYPLNPGVAWEQGMPSSLLAPLISRGRIIGGISCMNRQDGTAFDRSDLSKLSLLANQASVAIENAQLFQAMQQEKEFAQTLLANTTDGIHVMDAEGRVLMASNVFCEMLKIPPESVAGMRVEEWEAKLSPDEIQGTLAWLFSDPGRTGQRTDTLHRRSDGSLFEAEVAMRTHVLQGRPILIASSRDITERKRAEAELAAHRDNLENLVRDRTRELSQAMAAAETATVAKSAFLANMSHEIRTPLNAIMGMAHLLRRGSVTPSQTERLEKIQNAGQHLLEIINAILDLSKIEAGKFTLEELPVRLETIFSNVVSMLYERARSKGLSFTVEVENASSPLLGDPTRLQQCLLNFATNAIKFTESGSVTLHCHVLEQGSDDTLLRFETRDTGIGVSPEAAARLFTAFEQADTSVARKHGGTGLGLVITRKLAALMGGEAGMESTLGQGSLFWFTARLRHAKPSPEQESRDTTSAEYLLAERCRGRRVLLVEDEPINREVALSLIEEVGLHADTAADGQEALLCVESAPYDLILMDMQMPRMDGLEATRRIRLLPDYAKTPILAMTANAYAEDRQRCLDSGMDDFLTKPVDPDVLYGVLLKWLAPNPARGDFPTLG